MLLLTSCKEKTNKLNGVWYTIENWSETPYYFEAHINDTSFSVINQDGLSYIASYKIKGDILQQYVKDMNIPFEILDTINFQFKKTRDSFTLVNFINTDRFSKWKKIDSVEPVEFLKLDNDKVFSQEFRDRFILNFINKTDSTNAKVLLPNFDYRWGTNDRK